MKYYIPIPLQIKNKNSLKSKYINHLAPPDENPLEFPIFYPFFFPLPELNPN